MRLDKWLKLTGLIPRRTVANAACDAGKVTLDEQVARASHDVSVGQTVGFDLGRGTVRVEVLEVPVGNVSKERRATLYRARD